MTFYCLISEMIILFRYSILILSDFRIDFGTWLEAGGTLRRLLVEYLKYSENRSIVHLMKEALRSGTRFVLYVLTWKRMYLIDLVICRNFLLFGGYTWQCQDLLLVVTLGYLGDHMLPEIKSRPIACKVWIPAYPWIPVLSHQLIFSHF